MSSFQCPFCSSSMAISDDTLCKRNVSFESSDGYEYSRGVSENTYSNIELSFYKCPNCNRYTVFAKGVGPSVKDINTILKPQSLAKQFPDYIPKAIRQDYEEACAIVNLSPKASATLSRRCLQGIIRDFWGIKETNLSKAIGELEDKIPATQWRVIDGVRRIGNIGAHMEKDINLIVDIDPDEAQKLIKLIEHLLEQWYISRHEQELLYADIIGIDETKQSARKKTE